MRKTPLAILTCAVLFSLHGMADTVTLKDGTKYEGKITQETPEQVTMTVQVTAGITDERTIKRTDIAQVDKTSEEDLAYAALKNVKPDAMIALSEEGYKSAIATLNAFLEKYPQSTHNADVHAAIDALQGEQKNVEAGQVKLWGMWIPKKEIPARSQQIQAQTLYLTMKSLAAQGDVIGALNTFDQIEKTYPGSRAYPLGIEFVKPIVSSLGARVARANVDLKLEDSQWAAGIEVTPEPAKSQTIAAHTAQIAQYDAMVAEATAAKRKWPPFLPHSKTSLDALAAVITPEITRLAALPVSKMNASIATTDKASEAIASHDVDGALLILKDATASWPANEEAAYLTKWATAYIALRDHPETAPEVSKVATRPTAKPVALTPTPTATPKAATPTPAATATATPEPKESFTDFFFTIKGAVTVVAIAVVVLVVATVLQKKGGGGGDDDGGEVEG